MKLVKFRKPNNIPIFVVSKAKSYMTLIKSISGIRGTIGGSRARR